MSERDIMFEGPKAWVCRERNAYTVYRVGVTHSTSDSSYPKTGDGLSVAIARAKYLNRN